MSRGGILSFIHSYFFFLFSAVITTINHDEVWFKRPDGSKSNEDFSCFGELTKIKELACNVGDTGLIPGSGRSPGEGNAVFLPGEFHGEAWWATE